jgi:putative transcriptional regulator
VVPAEPADLVSAQPERLWPEVLRRQPGSLAILASYPTDLRAN